MIRVDELTPGDLVTLGSSSAVFIARTDHPLWPDLQLVIWRLDDGTESFDALSARQDVGNVGPSTASQREARLRAALLGPSPGVLREVSG